MTLRLALTRFSPRSTTTAGALPPAPWPSSIVAGPASSSTSAHGLASAGRASIASGRLVGLYRSEHPVSAGATTATEGHLIQWSIATAHPALRSRARLRAPAHRDTERS